MKHPPDLLEVLLPTDRATVSRACAAVGVRSHVWRRVRWIRLLVEVLSIDTLSGRLEAEGWSRSRAVEEAAKRLGLNPESFRQRGLRARRPSLEPRKECSLYQLTGRDTK